MNLHKQLTLLSVSLLAIGLAIATPIGVSWFERQQAVGQASPGVSIVPAATLSDAPELVKGVPRHISIPSLGIATDIQNGSYDAQTGQWTITEDAAFYATPTNLINSEAGNTLIYGHNSQKIFGKLLQIRSGSEVIVTTDNGYTFTYIYLSTEAVKPTDVAALEYSGKPRLTLQTCSGLWNETRQMVYFELKEYTKN